MQLRYALLMYGIDATLISGYDELHAVDMCVGSDDLIIVYSVSANGKLLNMVEDMVEQDHCSTALITMNPSSSFNEGLSKISRGFGDLALQNHTGF